MVAGFLFRMVMIARRRKIIVDRSEQHWIDDRNETALRNRQKRSGLAYHRNGLIKDRVVQPDPDWMDDQKEELRDRQKRPGSTRQWDRLTDDLQRSVIPISTISDYKPHLSRNDCGPREKPQVRDRDSDANKIGKHEDMFEQLRRDLDQLLQSPKVA
jgi:hypothetical protein